MKTNIARKITAFVKGNQTSLPWGGLGWAFCLLLLTACYHDLHEEATNEYDGKAVGYLTPQLIWEDEADAGSAIKALHFVISGTGGINITHDFSDAEEAAQWLQQLPVGDYDILVTVAMDEPSGYLLTAVPGAAPSENLLTPTSVALKDAASSPRQAWYAVTHATVGEGTVTVPELRLQRLLSELTVIVNNVPTGAAITASVERVAHDVLLTQRDSQGRYGVPGSADYLTVALGALTADATVPDGSPSGPATLRHDDHTLLPTAGGQERCYLTLTVTTPEGTRLTYLADAPRMDGGKAYVVELDYTKLRPYMLLSAFTINDWTEGWTISGEIINPDK